MRPELSVVILCYKAGQKTRDFVRTAVKEIEQLTKSWEMILVGNYLPGDTTDETPQVVRELAAGDQRIKAVTLEKKGMMGWDARSGLAQATGATIALIDGDGQMPPEDIGRVYRKLVSEELDMVKPYREQRHDGLLRKLNSDVYNIVFRTLFPGFPVQDVNSKPKIFRREFFNRLKLTANDWFIDAEIMIQARRYKCRLGEVPTVFYESSTRRSFVRVKHILEFLKNLAIARLHEFFIKK
jgi:glycosyltransferase involved in cell wall biosynthesis